VSDELAAPDAPKPGKIAVLLELVKFEHSIFALPYAFIGALYAAQFVGYG
jgi:hypothetical protein